MSITADGKNIALQGNCGADDAERLLGLLQTDPGREVDLTNATHLHCAVLQLLLVFRPAMVGTANDEFIRTRLTPVLSGE